MVDTYTRPRDGMVFRVGDIIRATDHGGDHERFHGNTPPEGVIITGRLPSGHTGRVAGFDDIVALMLTKPYRAYLVGTSYHVWLYHAILVTAPLDLSLPLKCRNESHRLVSHSRGDDPVRPIVAQVSLPDGRQLALSYSANGQFYQGFDCPHDLVQA